MWTRKSNGEAEFNYNLTMEDIRNLAEHANVTNLDDDDIFDLASEIEDRFVDMLYDNIGDIIYDLFGDREDEEDD